MKTHLTWYLKIPLTDDLSVRYYFLFEDKPSLNKKWIIKSHSRKEYSVINEQTAMMILESHNKTLNDAVEVMGREIKEGIYRKVELQNPFEIDEDIGIRLEKNTKDTIDNFFAKRFLKVE